MKRFLICTVRSDGCFELYDETNLPSEAERFEGLGYRVVDTALKDERVAA